MLRIRLKIGWLRIRPTSKTGSDQKVNHIRIRPTGRKPRLRPVRQTESVTNPQENQNSTQRKNFIRIWPIRKTGSNPRGKSDPISFSKTGSDQYNRIHNLFAEYYGFFENKYLICDSFLFKKMSYVLTYQITDIAPYLRTYF